ncbi:unnamed protein product [Ceratitis capitata]|uniref:(Mediterranean fruit fly) hypothetical protein n=1 Tax=Ceratitis capitata TaxID=7213 RepID=A0A811UME2_CERCA|nr:unnamed protein product [Ceratitis capitata]
MVKNKTNVHSAEALYQGVYKALRILVHLTAAVQFGYGIYYEWTYVKFPESTANMHSNFGGKFKYLTFLNAIIQTVYYVISLINDFVGTNEVAPKRLPTIRKVKDYIMASLAFPVALNVGITFWSLYAIDRELVLPRVGSSVSELAQSRIAH